MHKEFASQIKTNVIQVLQQQKQQLSLSKRVWTTKIEAIKKQIKEQHDTFKKEHAKYVQATTNVDVYKAKRDEQYLKFGMNSQ